MLYYGRGGQFRFQTVEVQFLKPKRLKSEWSEFRTTFCLDFGIVWILAVWISDIHCIDLNAFESFLSHLNCKLKQDNSLTLQFRLAQKLFTSFDLILCCLKKNLIQSPQICYLVTRKEFIVSGILDELEKQRLCMLIINNKKMFSTSEHQLSYFKLPWTS